MVKVKLIKKIKCKRCNHEWVPRKENVYVCPKCKSPKWNVKKDSEKLKGGMSLKV